VDGVRRLRMRRKYNLNGLIVMVLSATLIGGSASAEDGSTLQNVVLDRTSAAAGQEVAVTGSLKVSQQADGRIWTDPAFPDEPPNSRPIEPMVDLIEGRLEHAVPSDPLTLRIKLAPGLGPDVSKPYWYRWQFHLNDIWYFVEFKQTFAGATASWVGSWYYCKLALGSNCIHDTTPAFPVSFDSTTRTLTGRLPLADLAAVQPKRSLTQDQVKPVPTYAPEAGYTTPKTATLGALPVAMDRVGPFGTATYEPFDLPIATVFLGVAPRGTPSESVTYSRTAPVSISEGSMDVPFAGTISTAGLASGEYSVYVKGCFGPCAVQVVPLTIT
jgi:hypothetical protein